MNVQTMNRVAARLGFWAATLSALCFVVYTVAFVAIVRSGPLPQWTNLAEYVATVQQTDRFWAHLAQLSMLLFAPLFVVLLHSIHEGAPLEKKALSRIAISFGLVFAAFFSMHYFVQLTTVRLGIARGATEGLEQFIQLRPNAAITAISMLGSSLFLGLSSLFVAPVFAGDRLQRTLRAIFLGNGIICLGSAVAYVLDRVMAVFLLTTFGLGGAVMIVTVSLALLFRRSLGVAGKA